MLHFLHRLLFSRTAGAASVLAWGHRVRGVHPGERPINQASLKNSQKYLSHRRWINTEEKAKVVSAAWGAEFIKFLAALAISHQDDVKKRINRTMAT